MRCFIAAVVVVLVALVSRPTAADPTPPDDKDPGIAYALSIGGALAPVAIGAAFAGGDGDRAATGVLLGGVAMIFLPSAGHWYAGQAWTWGTAMRVVGASVLSLQAAYYIECEDCNEHTGGEVVSVASVALVVTGVVYDVATSGAAVRRWNEKHRSPPTPTVMHVGTGWGFGVVGTF